MLELAFTALGWSPLWVLLLMRRRPVHISRILMGAGLAGFVGGMCSVELRRHGLLIEAAHSVPLLVFGLRLEEVLRFALLGGAGVLVTDALLNRLFRRR